MNNLQPVRSWVDQKTLIRLLNIQYYNQICLTMSYNQICLTMHIDKMHVKLEYQLSSGMRGRLKGHVLPFANIKIYDSSAVCVIYHGLRFFFFF